MSSQRNSHPRTSTASDGKGIIESAVRDNDSSEDSSGELQQQVNGESQILDEDESEIELEFDMNKVRKHLQ